MARRRFFKRSKSESAAAEPPVETQAKANSRRATPGRSTLYNRLAWICLILTLLVASCYLIIFMIPTLPFNPFPPYSAAIATFAPTSTPQPTYTPQPTPTSTSTPSVTPRPTFTHTSTPTPKPTLDLRAIITGTARLPLVVTRTWTPTATPTSGPTKSPFNYTAEVLYQRAQLYGTNWSGLAGLIFGFDLKHQPGIGVKAWGDSPLGTEGQLRPSGTAPQYGPSGWEFTLGDKPISGKYNVQLLDANGKPLSPVVELELKGDPRANLAYVIFRQNH
jgi:hypothetical protein